MSKVLNYYITREAGLRYACSLGSTKATPRRSNWKVDQPGSSEGAP